MQHLLKMIDKRLARLVLCTLPMLLAGSRLNSQSASADGDFIQSLMQPIREPGAFAGWIAPPRIGIDNKPGDYEYVQLYMA